MRKGYALSAQPKEKVSARQKAMQYLERADRSVRELQDRLAASGYSEEEAADAVRYVQSFGYLDDSRFAANLIRRSLNSKSRQKIFSELYAKGIDPEISRAAWEEVSEEEGYNEERLIRQALRKKCPEGLPADPAEKKKIYGFLARKGFSFELVNKVLNFDDDV